MSEAFERAARALVAALEEQQLGSISPWDDPEFRDNAYRATRAVLEAIREPDAALQDAMAIEFHRRVFPGDWSALNDGQKTARRLTVTDVWQDGIDEVLRDG